jgi:hypothetical protein
MRHDLANRENALRRSSWLLPSYAAERLRVNSNGGDSVTSLTQGQLTCALCLDLGLICDEKDRYLRTCQ